MTLKQRPSRRRFLDDYPYSLTILSLITLRHLSRLPPFLSEPIFYLTSTLVKALKKVRI